MFSKKRDGETDSAESDPSDITIPYTKWRNESVNWAAFGEITSQPSSSVRIGEQSTTSGTAGDGVEDEDDGDDSAYSEESHDSKDSAWSSGSVASLFFLFGVSMPKGEKLL